MKAFSWLLYLPLLVIVAIFAAANRHDIEINLDPLPFGLTVPVFAIVFAAIMFGIIVGSCSAWVSGRQWRRNARNLGRQKALLETEMISLREKVDAQQFPISAIPGGVSTTPAEHKSRSATVPPNELTQ